MINCIFFIYHYLSLHNLNVKEEGLLDFIEQSAVSKNNDLGVKGLTQNIQTHIHILVLKD